MNQYSSISNIIYLEESNVLQKIFKYTCVYIFTLGCPMYFTDSALKVIEHVYLLLKTL